MEELKRKRLSENFELQLSEIEMLTSMYSNDGELIIQLPYILDDMDKFVNGKSAFIPNQLDFILNLDIPDIKDKLEVNITYPHDYPVVKPEVYARSVGVDRRQQKELNASIFNYLKSLPEGELCVLLLINWIVENSASFFTPTCCSKEKDNPAAKNKDDIFCRMWIYSHHIFNKYKRREIVDCGQDMNLTGFSLPGKPGFICIEGYKTDCCDFLQHIKNMSWRKISIVKEEIKDINTKDIKDFRKFKDFNEISFQVRRGPAKEYHMDMGQFLRFLEEHNCAYIFQELFGIEGQVNSIK